MKTLVLLMGSLITTLFVVSASTAQNYSIYFSCIQSNTNCPAANALRSNTFFIASGTVVTVAGWDTPGDGGGGDFVQGPICANTSATNSVLFLAGASSVVLTGMPLNLQLGESVTDSAGAIPPGTEISSVSSNTIGLTLNTIFPQAAFADTITIGGDNGGTLIQDHEMAVQCYYKTNYRGDPHEWGAYGDGTTDDTVAMENWLGAYGTVQALPSPTTSRSTFGPFTGTMPGTFLVNAPLTCPENATIQGPANMTNNQPLFTIKAGPAFSGVLPANNTAGNSGPISAQAVIGALDHCRISGVSVVGNGYYLPVMGTIDSGTQCIGSLTSVSGLQIGNYVMGSNIPSQTTVTQTTTTTCPGVIAPAIVVSQVLPTCSPSCTPQALTFYGPDAVDILANAIAIDSFSALSNGRYNLACLPTSQQGYGLQVKDTQLSGGLDDNFYNNNGCPNVRLIRDVFTGSGSASGSGSLGTMGGILQVCGPGSSTCDGTGLFYSGVEITISDGSIQSSQGYGLDLSGTERVSVNGMHIEGNGLSTLGGYGIHLKGDSSMPPGLITHTISICGNYLVGNGGDIPNSAQIGFAGALDNVNLCGNVYEPESLNDAAFRPLYAYDAANTTAITNTHIYDVPSPQASGQVYTTAAQKYLPQLQSPLVVQSQISGLTLSNDGSVVTQVDVQPGQATDSTNSVSIVSSQICNDNLASPGPRGLDVGTANKSTTYFIFAIASASGGSPSCMASKNLAPDFTGLSFSAPSPYLQKYTAGGFTPSGSNGYLYDLNSIAGLAPGQSVRDNTGAIIGTIQSISPGTLATQTQALAISVTTTGSSATVQLPSGAAQNIAQGMLVSDTFAFPTCTTPYTASGVIPGSKNYVVASVNYGASTFSFSVNPLSPISATDDCIVVSGGYTVEMSGTIMSYLPNSTFVVYNGVFRNLGAIYTTTSTTPLGTVVPFVQDNDTFYLAQSTADIPAGTLCPSTIGTSAISCPLSVPCGLAAPTCTGIPVPFGLPVEAFGRVVGGTPTTGDILLTSPLRPYQPPVNFPAAPGFTTNSSSTPTAHPFRLYTDVNGAIQVQTGASGTVVDEVTDGWIYHR